MEPRDEQGLPRARNERIDAPPYVPDPAPATKTVGLRLSPGVITVGVPRPQSGTRGVEFTVTTNHFAINFSDNVIYHYDDIRLERSFPVKFNLEIIRMLQEKIVPTVFTPRGVYDGRKNLFTIRRLALRGPIQDSQMFNVTLRPPYERPAPPVYQVYIRLVGHVNPVTLKECCNGEESINNEFLSSSAPLHIALRMKPKMSLPFNARHFFTDREVWPLGGGIELWRGYFQSIRPGVRSLLLNIDTSTGAMYAPGPMVNICHQILSNSNVRALLPGGGLSDRDRLKLQRFLLHVRFLVLSQIRVHQGRGGRKPKVLQGITAQGASSIRFTNQHGSEMTVSEYFLTLGITLSHPEWVCVKTVSGVMYPIELCYIIPGQLMRKQMPPDLVHTSVDFMKRAPHERLSSIMAGSSNLGHNTSEYMRTFGMNVDPSPQKCLARMLKAPLLDYGEDSTHRPENGSWNFKDRKLYEPVEISSWAVICYDLRALAGADGVTREIVEPLVSQATRMGIYIARNPPIMFPAAQSLEVAQHLQFAGQRAFQQYRAPPKLLVVVLSQNSADLYQAVKHFGDVTRGVATQCLKSNLSRGAREQYWANVCLKINAKLGGINTKLNPFDSPSWISDPLCPVMIIAMRIMHPPPGAHGRPSFVGAVGSLDSSAVRYTALNLAQESRVEPVYDLEGIVHELVSRHAWWKTNREKQTKPFPERIIYYQSGVSESQFSHILSIHLPAIQAACKRHKINPKITIVVVGRRHHVRFFPTHEMANRSGNCPAGTVVDNTVGNPQEFDFYLQSHSATLGTSRPSHYSVIYDENNFSQDGIQELTYALCHLNARSTRSLSVPAPLLYADRVSCRARHHYDPSLGYSDFLEDDVSNGEVSGVSGAQRYRDLFKPAHEAMKYTMYFQ
ncbi:argonaute protein [Rhizoctonia solani 123E]|uniref:Argonaute protein n=1 Tax=Rhizoctonia solani 123E TaxID=1423351 RepID=A0A074SAB8_9AGAM|nr:argonaute protein [Rhizoctonia solani 123E]